MRVMDNDQKLAETDQYSFTNETARKDQQAGHSLTPAQFRSVLEEIESLGLTWTSDLPPQLIAKRQNANDAFSREKLQQIGNNYPMFPNELGYVIWYALTGTKTSTDSVGTEADLKAKAEIVRELLITPEFRDEFFFRQLVKVPYIDNLDWEVIVKMSEHGVQRFPGNAYALVSILLEGTSHDGDKPETITFAINEVRLEKLLAVFTDMRDALQRARDVGNQLRECEDVQSNASV